MEVGTFALTAFLIELTPGPNMAYLAMLSAVQGRRAGAAATIGIATGLLVLGIAAALGVAALISGSRAIYETLRWAGIGYLFWLAWEGWQNGQGPIEADKPFDGGAFFRKGLITNLLNPKAAAFYVAVLPTFVDPSQSIMGQTVALSIIYVAVATIVHVSIVYLAGSARPFLDDPVRTRYVRRALSLGLAAVAVWFAYATAR